MDEEQDDPFTPRKYQKTKKMNVFKSQVKLPSGPNLQTNQDGKKSKRRHVKFMLSASGLTDITKID